MPAQSLGSVDFIVFCSWDVCWLVFRPQEREKQKTADLHQAGVPVPTGETFVYPSVTWEVRNGRILPFPHDKTSIQRPVILEIQLNQPR